MTFLTLATAMLMAALSLPLVGGAPLHVHNDGQAAPLEIEGAAVSAIAIDPARGEAHYAVAGSTLYRADGSGSWKPSGTDPGRDILVVDSREPATIWAGSGIDCYRGMETPQPLLMSSDAGATWTETVVDGFVPLASWAGTGVVLAHDCSGLHVSRDNGVTWSAPAELPLGSQITAFAVSASPESAEGLSILVGVTGEGGTSELYRLRLSDPDAIVVDGPLQTYYGFGAVTVDDLGAILLAAPQGVLSSADRGETWEVDRTGLESTTLPEDPIESFPTDSDPGSFGLSAIVTVGDVTYVSGVDGIYARSAQEQGWQHIASLNAEIVSLATLPGSGDLLAQLSSGEVLTVHAPGG